MCVIESKGREGLERKREEEKGIGDGKNVKKKENAGLEQSGCEYDCEKEDFPTFSTVAMFLGNHSAVYKSNDFTFRSWF